MKKYVITLSRQFASNGRAIAQCMSRELGISYYDRDIVEQTARRMGLSISEVSEIEENGAPLFARWKYPLGMGLVSMQQETFAVQSNIIRDLAAKDSCIIVGRCADSVQADYERCKNINNYAPYAARQDNCIRLLGMDEKTARKMIPEVDRAREIYRLRFSEGVSSVLDHRHLMIDSSWLPTAEKTAHVLCDVVREGFCD